MGFWGAFTEGARQVLGDSAPLLVLALGALAILTVAFRRRRDVDVKEMDKRIVALEARVETLETDLTEARDSLVERDRIVFLLRSTLARRGIPDPTLETA